MKELIVLIAAFITFFLMGWFIISKSNQDIDKKQKSEDKYSEREYNWGYVDGLHDMSEFINFDTTLSNNDKIILLEYVIEQSENRINDTTSTEPYTR